MQGDPPICYIHVYTPVSTPSDSCLQKSKQQKKQQIMFTSCYDSCLLSACYNFPVSKPILGFGFVKSCLLLRGQRTKLSKPKNMRSGHRKAGSAVGPMQPAHIGAFCATPAGPALSTPKTNQNTPLLQWSCFDSHLRWAGENQ